MRRNAWVAESGSDKRGAEIIAHISEVVGKSSELIARQALLANGWIVATTDTDEAFDIVARDPISAEWRTIQVKTIRVRSDRGGDLVVYAKRGNGEVYTQAEADYFIGVLGAVDGEPQRVYMFENRGLGEYWASQARAAERWVELSAQIDRDIYEGADVLCPAA